MATIHIFPSFGGIAKPALDAFEHSLRSLARAIEGFDSVCRMVLADFSDFFRAGEGDAIDLIAPPQLFVDCAVAADGIATGDIIQPSSRYRALVAAVGAGVGCEILDQHGWPVIALPHCEGEC